MNEITMFIFAIAMCVIVVFILMRSAETVAKKPPCYKCKSCIADEWGVKSHYSRCAKSMDSVTNTYNLCRDIRHTLKCKFEESK